MAKNTGWGTKHNQADREVRKTTSQLAADKQNEKGIVSGTAQARGEAITNRADLKEAANNARKSGGN